MSKSTLNVFAYVRLRPVRYRKTPRRATERTPEENEATAELISRTPQLFCSELQLWASDQLRPIYEAKRAARREQLASEREQHQ
jgi:hypothetical protein